MLTPEEIDHTPLSFGKYRGLSPAQIAETDPKYVVWMKETVVNRGELVSELLYKDCLNAPTPARNYSGQSDQRRIPAPAPTGSKVESRSHFDDPYSDHQDEIPF